MKELNDWEKRLRKQVSQWEDPLPGDGWQRLSEALEKAPTAPRRRRPSRRWFLAAPPAVAAAVLIGYMLLAPSPKTHHSIRSVSGISPQSIPAETGQTPTDVVAGSAKSGFPAGQSGRQDGLAFAPPPLPRRQAYKPEPLRTAEIADATPVALADTVPASTTGQAPHKAERKPARRSKTLAAAIPPAAAPARTSHSAKPQFRVAMSGTPTATERHEGYIALPTALFAPQGNNMKNTGALGALLTHNLRLDTHSRIHHHLPVQFTLGVDFPLTSRLTVGTGISYTRTTTDIEGGTSEAYYRTRQHLHYVGVPIRIGYTFARTSWADFYASGEARIAVSVGAKQSTELVVEDKAAGMSVTHDGRGLWQGSFSVSAGAELHLGRHLGLFVEPGMTYGLPDGSSIPTPYQDQPFRFSLQAGLRVKLH